MRRDENEQFNLEGLQRVAAKKAIRAKRAKEN
jgi:hypothetical protein